MSRRVSVEETRVHAEDVRFRTLFNMNTGKGKKDKQVLADEQRCVRRAHKLAAQKEEKDKHVQLCTPVKLLVVVKKLAETPDGEVKLVATVLQTPVGLMPKVLRPVGGDEQDQPPNYYMMRVNEGSYEHNDCFTMRKIKLMQAADDRSMAEEATTFLAKLPLIKREVFSLHPFHIIALETTIELTSCVGKLMYEDGTHAPDVVELRPNILANVADKRGLVYVKDETGVTADAMRSYDFVELSPTVEVVFDGGKGKTYYAPTLRLTWFVYRGWVQGFLETIMPIIFAVLCNIVNVGFIGVTDDYKSDGVEYIANLLGIGLTIVFIIPQLSSSNESFAQTAHINHGYVVLLFAGLTCALAGGPVLHSLADDSWEYDLCHFVALWLSNIFTVGSLLIPLSSWVRFLKCYRLIRAGTSKRGKFPNHLGVPDKATTTGTHLWHSFFKQSWGLDSGGGSGGGGRDDCVSSEGGIGNDLEVNGRIDYGLEGDAPVWKAHKNKAGRPLSVVSGITVKEVEKHEIMERGYEKHQDARTQWRRVGMLAKLGRSARRLGVGTSMRDLRKWGSGAGAVVPAARAPPRLRKWSTERALSPVAEAAAEARAARAATAAGAAPAQRARAAAPSLLPAGERQSRNGAPAKLPPVRSAVPVPLAVGDRVDVLDVTDAWAQAEVVATRAGPAEVKVHFLHWADSWDEWLSVAPGVAHHRIARLGAHTFTGLSAPRPRQRLECRRLAAPRAGEFLVAHVVAERTEGGAEAEAEAGAAGPTPGGGAHAAAVRVHYHGLDAGHDEWVARPDWGQRLVPFGTHHQMG
eukprot:g1508.t1